MMVKALAALAWAKFISVLDVNEPQNLAKLICFDSGVSSGVSTMSGVQAESNFRSRGDVEELLGLLWRLNVGRGMGMEDQVQAKLLCYLGCFRDHLRHLLPLLDVQALAAIP